MPRGIDEIVIEELPFDINQRVIDDKIEFVSLDIHLQNISLIHLTAFGTSVY